MAEDEVQDRAEQRTGRVFEKEGTLTVGTVLSGAYSVAALFIGVSAVLAFVVQTEPGYHLPADHHDPIAIGVDIGLTAALLFVGGKLVAQRTFRL